MTSTERRTVFSPCRRYRYTLWREFREQASLFDSTPKVGYVQFIGLNPSTADETNNDPTVTRCINFTKAWGYPAYCMTNIFAWRDTDPSAMKLSPDPVGPENNHWLLKIASTASLIVAAWGNHGTHLNRNSDVMRLLSEFQLKCFKITQSGQPEHPLYQRNDAALIPYVQKLTSEQHNKFPKGRW